MMRHLITDPLKDPLGAMVLDYAAGNVAAAVQVSSTNLDMWEMSGKVMFRKFSVMNRIEKKALQMCNGRVLDVGAGAGCHTRYLKRRKIPVLPIDISPGCTRVMLQNGISNARHCNLFSLEEQKFDTILMLMNGIGICGHLDGLNLFFQFLGTVLNPGGSLLTDSTDLNIPYPDLDPGSDSFGETTFTMQYGDIKGDPFDWIYINYDKLFFYAGLHGFSCQKIMQDRTGKYLVRICYN